MKKLLILGLILFLSLSVCEQIPVFAQDKNKISATGLASIPIDDKAGTHGTAFGFGIFIERQAGERLMLGVSYVASKIWGEGDFLDFGLQEYDVTSKFFFKPLTERWNFYFITGAGLSLVKPENQSKEANIGSVFGVGYLRTITADIGLDVNVKIRNFGDNVSAFQPSLGATFGFSL